MSGDPLDDVRRALFANARNEQPHPDLLGRVLGFDTSAASERSPAARTTAVTRVELPPAERPRRSRLPRRPRGLGVGLAALAACGLAVLCKYALDAGEAEPRISAEKHLPNSSAAASRTSEASRKREALESAQATEPHEAAVPRDVTSRAPTRASVPTRSLARPERAQVVPRSTPLAEAPTEAQTAPQPALLAEVNLLKQARTALRGGDAALALELLDRYTGELHGTDLNAEATLLRIETLVSLERASDAAQLAQRFVAENPDSPLVDRARSFLDGSHRTPSQQTP